MVAARSATRSGLRAKREVSPKALFPAYTALTGTRKQAARCPP
jgi:hypothetical protein